jgi:hypothetical protein
LLYIYCISTLRLLDIGHFFADECDLEVLVDVDLLLPEKAPFLAKNEKWGPGTLGFAGSIGS